MSTAGEWARRLWYLLNRRRFEDALARDMRAHRDAMGDPRRFGNDLLLRDRSRDVWGWRWLDDLMRDWQFALRTLWRAKGFTTVIVLTLALATGATTAIFSLVSGVLLRPLPFAEPDRLVQVHGRQWREDRGERTPDPVDGPVASPELEQYILQSTAFDGFTSYFVSTTHLDESNGRQRLTAAKLELNAFDLLGVAPLLGRPFRPGDSQDVAVISARLWRQVFAADRTLPGRVVMLDNRPHVILGVMADSFQFPYSAASILQGALPESRTDVWLPSPPLRAAPNGELRRGRSSVVARMKRGTTVAQAQAELVVIARRIEAQSPDSRVRVGVRLVALTDAVVGQVRRSLWMLFAAVGLVLAAACANVANLLLARMTVRSREVVTRAALGAGRGRLVRQFLAESLLLAAAGALGGIVVARWATRLLVIAAASRLPRAHEVALDWRVFTFLALVCLMTAVVFGLAPALTAARADARQATTDAGERATLGRGYGRLRDALVVVEVALAFVLAAGAALVVREVIRLERTADGMAIENVLALHLTPRVEASDYYAIAQRVARLPGVRAAGLTQLVPLQNWGWDADVDIPGRPTSDRRTTGLRYVTPGYFRTLGIPLVRGRGLTEGDTATTQRVILINKTFARRYFKDEDPVGRETNRGTIVGVVGDVRQVSLDRDPEPELYYPMAQNVTMAPDIGMSLLVRTSGPPEPLTDAIRAAVRETSPALAIFNVRTMAQIRDDSLSELHLYRWLIGLFAALAIVLAAIGLYGVMSYTVSSRLREFAIRLALGSEPSALMRLVFARGLRLATAGLIAGATAVWWMLPWLERVFAAARTGLGTYAIAAAGLLVIALAASAIPAWRVTGVNPVTALRHE